MAIATHINPETMLSNPAFTQVVRVPAGTDIIYIGGQNGLDGNGQLAGPDLGAQARQALANLQTCLAAAGAAIENVVKWTILVVDGHDVRTGFAAFQQVWGQRPNPPAITVAKVAGLAIPGALVEIDAVAAVPA
ncbi:RidA family protein [Nocardia spumae]|uniref:RidA family protein n=1 Tax=Nocardia spumae TaxID=2887190 RepID=UPI001D13599E|nr:RidA family protein [Nocardia spumae]